MERFDPRRRTGLTEEDKHRFHQRRDAVPSTKKVRKEEKERLEEAGKKRRHQLGEGFPIKKGNR